ncbi:MAG TPA: ATP-binding cassette domain-containing protein [Bacteroidales bacterium]|nr:ATP-binding cassette domain-containing protein [Bacteroidales bacterium]
MDIIVKNLSKNYGTQKAVDDISFEVKTGEILGFLGPNGAGKTTTMKAITSYLSPSSGTIHVGPYSIFDQPEDVKRCIGYLPETNPLYEEMGVIDYLIFCAEIQGIEKGQIKERVRRMVHVCGLEVEKHKKIAELSKGYRQRVGLAQALIHDPQVLILDEPTTGLDPNQIVEIRELIKKIGKEKTVILSSHILAEVEATCDRIMIISKGKIVADGTPEQLRKKATGRELLKVTIEDCIPGEAYAALQSMPTIENVENIDSVAGSFEVQSKPEMSSRREIFLLCKQKGWILSELTPVETKLEDIFRELTLN